MLQAIGNKVIIKSVEKKDKTDGGILLPTAAKGLSNIGEVISIGELVKSVKVGQKVMFSQWEKIEMKHEDVMYYVFEDKHEHLLAIVE